MLVFFGFLTLVQRVEGRMLGKKQQGSHPIVRGTSGWFTDNEPSMVMLCPIVTSGFVAGWPQLTARLPGASLTPLRGL